MSSRSWTQLLGLPSAAASCAHAQVELPPHLADEDGLLPVGQVLAGRVLDERQAAHLVLGPVDDRGRDGRQAGPLGRLDPAVAEDDLQRQGGVLRVLAHLDVADEPVLPDRVDERPNAIVVHVDARLIGVGREVVQGEPG